MSQRVSTIFVSHRHDLSGAPRCLFLILKHINRTKFDISLVCPGPGPLAEAAGRIGVPVYLIPKYPSREGWIKRITLFRFMFRTVYRLIYTARLFLLFRRGRPQVVFLNTLLSSGATIAAKLNRLPVVVHLHEYKLQFAGLSGLRRSVVLKNADRFVAVSQAVQSVASAYGVDPSAIDVAHPAIDTASFFKNGEKPPIEIPGRYGINSVVFGAAGALVRYRGFQDLIRAMTEVVKSIEHAVLLIAGTVPEDEYSDFAGTLQETVKDSGLEQSVVFLGHVSHMRSFYHAVDIVVVPSQEESFGLVALEAMLMKRPIVATRVGGLPEIVIDGETGILVPEQNPRELAAAMIRLGSDAGLRERMGTKGEERARRAFSEEQYVTAIEEALMKVACKTG